ncbi:MAG TPA: rhodanese-like domain-containing protein [Coxiellaceae bacterium]|nr:MAG: hypothetical protein A3E81_00650 [Gammaproteobacteria bacterium RIFCSPHIGHO2_12_FULL_36_30]HLB56668.1 rhodanese-like domain-containing protein [Coxiellaceae bacterium]
MLHEIIPFVIKHWPLVTGFFIVLILLITEELKSKSARGEQVTAAVATHLINREDAIVIDLRDANAYREGHIVNAKNIPTGDFEHNQEKLNAYRDRPIILVDSMGLKTTPIVLRLKQAGFQKVSTLKGGMDGWKTSGMPVTKK